MKSLSIYIIITILFNCYIYGSIHHAVPSAKQNSAKVPTVKAILKGQPKIPIKQLRKGSIPLPKILKSAPTPDNSVCGLGKNLGLLTGLNTCRSIYSDCSIMIKRTPNPPKPLKTKLVTKITKNGVQTKTVLAKKPKKHWSLKARNMKYLKKTKSYMKLPVKVRQQIAMKVDANKTLKKILKATKSGNPNEIKKVTQNMVSKKLNINKPPSLKTKTTKNSKPTINSLVKSIKNKQITPPKPIVLKPAKKVLPKTGNFCVHAVVLNLNYCCFYKQRNAAESFANTQPEDKTFYKLLLQGHRAEVAEKEKQAKDIVKNIAKAMSIMNGGAKPIAKSTVRAKASGKTAVKASAKASTKTAATASTKTAKIGKNGKKEYDD